ncbi:hypothetical protein Sp245p_16485 (plasmid) [Azospirillum baldaniorum]|nr:hypothetical protein Sp245p_16485 [Azospirillum baldaniorum]TWA83702.1 hypothetical protein FBZ85_101451 [Azospirillum brasilense]
MCSECRYLEEVDLIKAARALCDAMENDDPSAFISDHADGRVAVDGCFNIINVAKVFLDSLKAS